MLFPLPNASLQIFTANPDREMAPYVPSLFCTPRAISLVKVPVRAHPALVCQKFDDDHLLRNVAHS